MQRSTVLAALALFAACAVVLWPGPFASGLLGHPTSDLAYHVWGTDWFGGELVQGRLPFYTRVTHLPEGGWLYHADPFGALLVLPLRPLGPVLAWNLLVTLQVLAAAAAGFALGRALTQSDAGALTAGVVCAAAPYNLGLIHSGLSEYLGIVWPIFALWAVHRAAESPDRWRLAAFALWLCTAQAFYYGAFGALWALCVFAAPPWRLTTLAKILVTWLVASAPLIAAATGSFSAQEAAFTAAEAPGWSYTTLPATDLLSWIRPGDWVHPDTPRMGNPGILHVNYLGWAALIAALWAYVRDPRLASWRRPALFFGLFALGPSLSINRRVLSIGAVASILPMAALYLLPFSPWRAVHHPYRIAAFIVPLLAIGAACAASRLPRALGWALPAVILAESLLASAAPWPLLRAPFGEDAALYAKLPAEGHVLDWPPDNSVANRGYVLNQLIHRRGIAYGVNEFLPDPMRRDPLVGQLLRALRQVDRRARDRDVPFPGLILPPVDSGETRLGEWGFGAVVVHPQRLSPPERSQTKRLLREALGPPIVENDRGWVFAVERAASR